MGSFASNNILQKIINFNIFNFFKIIGEPKGDSAATIFQEN